MTVAKCAHIINRIPRLEIHFCFPYKHKRPLRMTARQLEQQWPVQGLLNPAAVADPGVGNGCNVRGLRLWTGIGLVVNSVRYEGGLGIDPTLLFHQTRGMDEDLIHGGNQPSLAVADWHVRVGKRILIIHVITTQVEFDSVQRSVEFRPPYVKDDLLTSPLQ